MKKGVACQWNSRGFGFIRPDDGGEDLFCHFSVITDGNALREGDKLEFYVEYDDRKGKYRATGVIGGIKEDSMGGKGGFGGKGGGSQECRDFQRGNCSRGSSCRFSHEGGGGGGDRYGGDRYGGGDRYDDRDRDRGYDRGGYDRGYDRGSDRDRYDDRRGDRDRYDDRRGGDRY